MSMRVQDRLDLWLVVAGGRGAQLSFEFGWLKTRDPCVEGDVLH